MSGSTEVDVTTVGGYWPISTPFMVSPYAHLDGQEILFATLGSLRAVEGDGQFAIPRPCVTRQLLVRTTGDQAQPEDGDLVVTVRKNGEDTPLSVTIPHGSAPPHSYLNRESSGYFSQGDLLSIKIENLSASGSAVISSIAFELAVHPAQR